MPGNRQFLYFIRHSGYLASPINPRIAIVSQIVEKIQKASIKTLSSVVEQIMTDVEHYVVDRIG